MNHRRSLSRNTFIVAGLLLSAYTIGGCANSNDTKPPSGTGGSSGGSGGTGGTSASTGGTGSGAGGAAGGRSGTGGAASGTGGTAIGTGGVAGAKGGTGGGTAGTGGTKPGTGGAAGGKGGTGGATATGGSGSGGSAGGSGPVVPPLTGSIASAAQACADMPISQTGTVYYACDCGSGADASCTPGDDTKDGKTPGTAWRTYQKLQGQFANLNPGDTIAFCRGGVFAGNATNVWVNSKCKASSPCTVRDYTPSGAPANVALPKLSGAEINLNDPGNAEHEEGYQFLNLDLDGGAGYSVEFGILAGNDIKDVLFCDMTVTGYQNGMYVGTSKPATSGSGSDTLNARITLRGSQILNNSNLGYLGACDGCVVEYNLFDHNGDANNQDHDIYFSGAADGNGNHYTATGERVVGNQLYHAAQGTGTVCMGDPLVVHGNHDGLLIQGNTIVQDPGTADGGCWGIAVTPGYGSSYAESFSNIVIAGNTVVDVGNISIYTASCQNCTIEDNLVIQSQSAFNSTGIQAHLSSGTRDAVDQAMNAVQIINNTIYFDQPSVSFTGIVVGLEGTGHVVASNLILANSAKRFDCLGYDLSPSAYYSDYNVCWNLTGSVTDWEQVSGGSLATWQSKSGLDKHSMTVNPMIKMPAVTNYDFRPVTGSPLIGAGDPSHSATIDGAGNPRPSPSDIGALQH